MIVRILLASIVFSLFPFLVIAAPPDSGQILREQMQMTPAMSQRLPEPVEETQTKTSTANDVKITVTGFKFTGQQSVATQAELEHIVSSDTGRELTLAELQLTAGKVTHYLRAKGYFLAKAYLPKQEITDGIVEIAVITGQVQEQPVVQLSGTTRIKERVISKMTHQGVTPGKPLQQKSLERSILLINDLPGVSAKSILQKGDTHGTTKVTIEAKEGALLSGLLSANNFGNRYTGIFQGMAQGAANNLSGFGDQLSLSATGSEGLAKGTVAYQAPLGYSGLKTNLSFDSLFYKLGKEYDDLDVEGTSNTFSADLKYPLIRTRNFSLWQALDYEYRRLEDEIGGIKTRDRTLHVGAANTTINSYDRWMGGGLTNAFLGITIGDLHYGLDSESATDDITAEAEGIYYKFSYSLSRLQRLTQTFSFLASVSGQLANQNLDSSEKFILGGPTGVRAYPVGEASGDEGHSLTTEIRYNLPQQILSSNLQCVAFFDTGYIKLHKAPWTNSVTSATGNNSYFLSGAGLGFNLDKPGLFSARASFAHVLGRNPGRTTDNKNADNKDDDQQVWLQLIFWF